PPCRHASPSVCVSLVTCQLVIFLNMASWQTDHGMSRVVVGKGPPRAPSIFGVLPCFDDTKLFGRAIQRALRYVLKFGHGFHVGCQLRSIFEKRQDEDGRVVPCRWFRTGLLLHRWS